MAKTFTAIDQDGNIIATSRGKLGAAQKAVDALYDYRAAVKTGSGNLYGRPDTLGHIAIDGVRVDATDGMTGYYAADLAR